MMKGCDMRITTKGRYGLRAMVDLAQQNGKGPILMSDIAKRLGVSRKYLHALLTSLRGVGLVRSVRGSGGGYCLSRSPEEINLAEILGALEGHQSLVDCVWDPTLCPRAERCVARELWQDLGSVIESHLSGISLRDLANRGKGLGDEPGALSEPSE